MRRLPAVALAAAFLAAGATLVFVALRGPAPPTTIDDRVRQVAATLRCPVCLDLSVADSPSLVARQMRDTIARRLRAGQTPDQIRNFFVSRFGESILLTPRAHGIGLVAWLVPGLLFAAGLALLVLSVRQWTRPGAGSTKQTPVSEQDHLLLQRELEAVDGETG